MPPKAHEEPNKKRTLSTLAIGTAGVILFSFAVVLFTHLHNLAKDSDQQITAEETATQTAVDQIEDKQTKTARDASLITNGLRSEELGGGSVVIFFPENWQAIGDGSSYMTLYTEDTPNEGHTPPGIFLTVRADMTYEEIINDEQLRAYAETTNIMLDGKRTTLFDDRPQPATRSPFAVAVIDLENSVLVVSAIAISYEEYRQFLDRIVIPTKKESYQVVTYVSDEETVSFDYPTLGRPSRVRVIEGSSGQKTFLVQLLSSTTPSNEHSQYQGVFSTTVIPNPELQTLEEWFAGEVDPTDILIASGAYSNQTLASEREVLMRTGPNPDSYDGGPISEVFMLSDSGEHIIVFSITPDNDLASILPNLSSDEYIDMLLVIANSIHIHLDVWPAFESTEHGISFKYPDFDQDFNASISDTTSENELSIDVFTPAYVDQPPIHQYHINFWIAQNTAWELDSFFQSLVPNAELLVSHGTFVPYDLDNGGKAYVLLGTVSAEYEGPIIHNPIYAVSSSGMTAMTVSVSHDIQLPDDVASDHIHEYFLEMLEGAIMP